jgi:hypothetical protein
VPAALLILLLQASPESERLLLGKGPFFRQEGMERAVREGDTELLHRAAKSAHWDARRLAAIGLGPQAPPELLDDKVAVVREAAVRALDLAAPEARLLALLDDPDDAVRAAAAWALRARSSKAEVRALLRDPSPAVVTAALAASGGLGQLRTLARSQRLDEAVPAIEALARAGGPAEAAALLAQLSRAVREAGRKDAPLLYLRDDPTADLAVARAVGDLARRGVAPGGRSVAAHLRKILEGVSFDGAGSEALLLAEAVAGARDAEAARRILDAQLRASRASTLPQTDFEPALRGILHAFAREPWPELAPLLAPLLADRDPAVRIAVVGALHGDAARPALRDASPLVRAAACAQVGKPDPLLEALRDADPRVQAAAARALGRIGDPVAVPALEALLEGGGAGARHAVVGALLRIDCPRRVEHLYRAATRDADAKVRAAAAAVLDFLESGDAIARAVADLLHDEPAVRANAIALLHVLTAARHAYDPASPAEGAAAWRAWWERKAARERPSDGFQYHVEDLRRRGIDLVLVLDATGSMAPVLQATKRRLAAVATEVRRIVPDLRVRIVAFRDRGDAFLTLASPLTHEIRVLEDFLACIPASGGGDGPESVLAGLREAFEGTPWRNGSNRVVLLFGDAPPHAGDRPLLDQVLKEFKGTVHAVDVGAYAQNAAWSGNEADFRAIAAAGRGVYVRLGEDEDLLRAILVLTLGPAHREAVEALFGL